MAPQKRMMLKADVNRIYDEEVYSEQKIREEKFFVRPSRRRKMKKGKLFSVGMGLDLPFCIIILVLLTIGMIMMFSASYAYAYYNQGDSYYYLVRQLIFAVIGVGIMFVLSFFNYNKLHKVAPVVLAISYLCLLVVLVLPGSEGVKRWIPLGIFNIQPSEIAKFAIILFFSHWCSKYYNKMQFARYSVLPGIIVFGSTALLLFLEPHYSGITNKMLAKSVKKVMLAVPDAKKYFDKNVDFVITGNPVRQEILTAKKEESRKELGLDNRPVVLSFGGSLGARKINEAVADLVARSGIDGRYQHIHAYGSYGDWFPQLVEEKGTDIADCPNLDIRPYIDNMPTCMAAADLVISRAGAITLSEIQAMGKPAILIPSPNVAENHQYHNAMALVNAGAADIIEEKDLTGAALMRKTDKMLLNPEKLEKYSENSRKMAITDANERIYSVVKKVLGLV